MSKTRYVYVDGKAFYAKLKPENRDTGANLPEGSDQRNKIEEVQGYYVMNLQVTPEAKKKAIADGIPNKGMTGQLWKEDEEGNPYYKAKRAHFNPKFTDRETGEQGVVMGPPDVLLVQDGKNVPFDGLIGNESDVTVKFSVWDEKKVEMLAVRINDLVEYESEGVKEDF